MKTKNSNPLASMIGKALQLLLLVTFAVTSQAAVESTTYIITDHLGSPILATDEGGQVKWQEDYQPYGTQIIREDTDNTVGFTGHRDDKTLDVTYMQGRWYHPEMGRFMAIDPVGFVEGSPQSFNRYAYANNNPYRFIDPDGRFSIELKSNHRLRIEMDDSEAKKRFLDGAELVANRFKKFKRANDAKSLGETLFGPTSTSQLPGKSDKQYWKDIEIVDRQLQAFFETDNGRKYPGFNKWYAGDQWSPETFSKAMREFGDYLQQLDGDNKGPSIARFKELYGSPWDIENVGGLLHRERERSGISSDQ